jgi:hypothetical protein
MWWLLCLPGYIGWVTAKTVAGAGRAHAEAMTMTFLSAAVAHVSAVNQQRRSTPSPPPCVSKPAAPVELGGVSGLGRRFLQLAVRVRRAQPRGLFTIL